MRNGQTLPNFCLNNVVESEILNTVHGGRVGFGLRLFRTGGSRLTVGIQGTRLSILKPKLRLSLERLAEVVFTSVEPDVPATLAEGPEHLVVEVLHPVTTAWLALGRDDVHLGRDLCAIVLEGQIVDVLTKGVLDFATDEEEPKDNVACSDSRGNSHPLETAVKLEGEQEHVDEGDLRNGNSIGDRERGRENSFGTCEDIVQCCNIVVYEKCFVRYNFKMPRVLKMTHRQ